jgi:glycosyltransferase involved in cell wall biosynthesis
MASRLIDITLGRYVLTSATDVLGVSHAVVNFVKRLSGRTAEVFYNAVHIPVNVEKSRKNRLVFVGRIVARKGWELALEIAQKIHWEGNVPQFEAVFLGEGNEMALLRRKERSIENDSHWLHILGRVTPDEVTKWLSGAVLVNPTTLSEGFQTTLLEALVVDAQIVTYPVPGSEILISQGAPVSVLETDDPEAWTETIRNALLCPAAPVSESVLEFWSWTKRAEQYELICRGLLFDADRLE